MMAAPFDIEKLELTGKAVPVLEEVALGRKISPAAVEVAGNGMLVYVPYSSSTAEEKSVMWLDQTGKLEPLSTKKGRYGGAVLSPDGTRVALTIQREDEEEQSEIHILERRRELVRPIVTGESMNYGPLWSPDLKWIVFASHRDSPAASLYRIPTDFSGAPELLTTGSDRWQMASHFSPDGRTLAITEWNPDDGESGISLLHFDESGQVHGDPQEFANKPGSESGARFSPDGKWIAYAATSGQQSHIFVSPASGSGASVQVSIEPAYIVRWSPVENRLYFSGWRVDEMYAVSFSTENGVFEPELPEVLFELGVSSKIESGFEVSPDGKRFIIVAPTATDEKSDPVNPRVILNWFEDLKSKTSSGGIR